MNFPTKKWLLISQQPMIIGFFNDLLTSGTSISPELILSMMSWGGDLSMEHPTDWAVPTKSKRKIILKCTCFLVNINFLCQGIKLLKSSLHKNWYIWTPNQGLKLIFFVICCQQFNRFIFFRLDFYLKITWNARNICKFIIIPKISLQVPASVLAILRDRICRAILIMSSMVRFPLCFTER